MGYSIEDIEAFLEGGDNEINKQNKPAKRARTENGSVKTASQYSIEDIMHMLYNDEIEQPEIPSDSDDDGLDDEDIEIDAEVLEKANEILAGIASEEQVNRFIQHLEQREAAARIPASTVKLLEEVVLTKEQATEEAKKKDRERKRLERHRKSEKSKSNVDPAKVTEEFRNAKCSEGCKQRYMCKTTGKQVTCLQYVLATVPWSEYIHPRNKLWVDCTGPDQRVKLLYTLLDSMTHRSGTQVYGRTQFLFCGLPVCKMAWVTAHGFKRHWYDKRHADWVRNRADPAEHGNTGRAKQMSVTDAAKTWMTSFFVSVKESSPEHPDHCWIPVCYSKRGVWQMYRDECKKRGVQYVALTTFLYWWRRDHPGVEVSRVNHFAKCTQCVATLLAMRAAKSNEARKYIKAFRAIHMELIRYEILVHCPLSHRINRFSKNRVMV